MIPPACNMALTFTAEGGAADWISGSRLGHPLQIGHRRHWEKTVKEWESSLGEGRETGERQEANGRNEEEREEQRKEGAKGQKEERKDKRNKDGKREMLITVEAERNVFCLKRDRVYLLLTPTHVSSGGEVEVFFTGSGSFWRRWRRPTHIPGPQTNSGLESPDTHAKKSVCTKNTHNFFLLLWFLQSSCFLSVLDAFIFSLCTIVP